MFFATDFMLGAGMVIIQPATAKVVIVHESARNYWFLPKGRKDVGESLEQTALREAHEESGYRVGFLPLYTPTNAPLSPEQRHGNLEPNHEPIYVSIMRWNERRRRGVNGGEYLTFWYVGQIAEDAEPEANTGMPDEVNYRSHIMDFEEAYNKLQGCGHLLNAQVLHIGYYLWQEKVRVDREQMDAASASRPEPSPNRSMVRQSGQGQG